MHCSRSRRTSSPCCLIRSSLSIRSFSRRSFLRSTVSCLPQKVPLMALQVHRFPVFLTRAEQIRVVIVDKVYGIDCSTIHIPNLKVGRYIKSCSKCGMQKRIHGTNWVSNISLKDELQVFLNWTNIDKNSDSYMILYTHKLVSLYRRNFCFFSS